MKQECSLKLLNYSFTSQCLLASGSCQEDMILLLYVSVYRPIIKIEEKGWAYWNTVGTHLSDKLGDMLMFQLMMH